MKHIAYAETEFATDERLADLVLAYATVLARSSSADTITIPGRVAAGRIETVSMLVGPASQITAWSDQATIDAPGFEEAVALACADVEERIRHHSANIGASDGEDGPAGIDAFDDLA